MDIARLALRHITGNSFRSGVVAMCALLVAALAVSATLITRGAEDSLQLALQRLGADILVVPQGAEARVETALLMGKPIDVWMPRANLDKVAGVPGVTAASPQIYVASLANASCCSASEMFIVVYDPATDFTVTPWLRRTVGDGLHLGEVVGGWRVFVPEGQDKIKLYGYLLTLKANLEATGTGLDQTMFVTLETAQDVARVSLTQAERPLKIPPDSISSVLVRTGSSDDAPATAQRIMAAVPGVTAIQSPDLFKTFRQQMTALLRTTPVILGFTWVLSVALIALIFSMAAHERRRQLGVLRALGATRGNVFQSLLLEAGILALAGGAVGVMVAALAVYLFRNFIVQSLALPFLLPSLPGLLLALIGSLAAAVLTVLLAALLPALRISRMEPSVAMRE